MDRTVLVPQDETTEVDKDPKFFLLSSVTKKVESCYSSPASCESIYIHRRVAMPLTARGDLSWTA